MLLTLYTNTIFAVLDKDQLGLEVVVLLLLLIGVLGKFTVGLCKNLFLVLCTLESQLASWRVMQIFLGL